MTKPELISTIPLPDMPRVRPDIITSLAEVDFYKFKMLYFVWHTFIRNGVEPIVEYSFQQRGDISSANFSVLPEILTEKEIQSCIDHVLSLTITDEILAGLHASGQFTEHELEFFSYLKNEFSMSPHVKLRLHTESGKPDIRVKDRWDKAMFWETMIMDIISELRTAKFVGGDKEKWKAMVEANNRSLLEDLTIMLENSLFALALFGLRRRASSQIEEFNSRQFIEVLQRFGKEKQILGIANTDLGIRLNKRYPPEHQLRLMGTYAHELPMVFSGLYAREDDLAGYFRSLEILQIQMQALFGDHLSLPDTFTSAAWFGVMSTVEMRSLMQDHYLGDRQDSGDPLEHALLQEEYIRSTLGWDEDRLRQTQMFPSDGLDFPKASQLISDMKARGGIAVNGVGIGTKTTNKFGKRIPPLNIVKKPTAVNDYEVAKRGDGTGKGSGSPKTNERLDKLIEGSKRLNSPGVLRVLRV